MDQQRTRAGFHKARSLHDASLASQFAALSQAGMHMLRRALGKPQPQRPGATGRAVSQDTWSLPTDLQVFFSPGELLSVSNQHRKPGKPDSCFWLLGWDLEVMHHILYGANWHKPLDAADLYQFILREETPTHRECWD